MKAEIIAVGTEILLGQITNTNAQFLGQELAALGVSVYHESIVGDNKDRLIGTFQQAWARADLVILTGGLGPTTDDLTREAVAKALGLPLEFQADVWQSIVAHMQRAGRLIPQNNRRQAMVPEGAQVLPNPHGTAPGLLIRQGGRMAVLLPGPPREMQPMFIEHVRPVLLGEIGHSVIFSRSLRIVGIGESDLEEKIKDLIALQSNPTIALYAKLGEVQIRLTAKATDEAVARRLIMPLEQEIRCRLGAAVIGVDDDTLPGVLGNLLLQKGYTLALAESCTGGLLGSMITSVPGSSAYFVTSLVTYSNAAKERLLGVPAAILTTYGAVSAECAQAMAAGARRVVDADVSIAITGIAGPDGGTADKPVGTVYIAVSAPEGETVRRFALRGERAAIRERAAKNAMNLARLLLLGEL